MRLIAVHAPRVTYYQGGAERYVLNLLIELSKRDKKISLISYDAPKKTGWFKDFTKKFKGNIYLLKSKKIDKKFKIFKSASKPSIWDMESKLFGEEASKFYLKNKFEVIICHYTVDCLYLPENLKIYLHLHGLPDKKRKKENIGIKIPKKIIAVSNYVAEGWKRLHSIKKRIFIVPNGIFLNQSKSNNKSIDIIYFGRLIKIKGVHILLKTIQILGKEGRHLSVKIIGEGPEKNNLIKLSKKLKLKNILFLGKVTDKELVKNISLSKISVFPSYKREGIMTTLLEAGKYKSAILASDSCSIREFIIDKENGLLFKPKNVKDLAIKLGGLLLNDCLRLKLTKNCSKTLRNFTWEKQARKLLKIYNS